MGTTKKTAAAPKAAAKRAPAKRAPASAAHSGGAKSAATRARVVDAAATVLAAHGYAGTRLTDVAREARVQAPAIYYYFTSREDLVEHVIVEGVTRLRAAVETALDDLPDDAPALERIDAALAAHLRFVLSESDYARAAVRNARQVPREMQVRYRREARRLDDTWRGLFGAAAAEGELRDDVDPDLAHLLVLGTVNWSPEWWTPRRGSIDKVVAQAQAFVRAAIS